MRVVVALIEMAEKRALILPPLSATVAAAVAELDPRHERDTSATWWQDLPAWQSLDSLDRLRRAHDQLAVLEVQARIVVQDLRGMFRLQAVGSLGRPLGYGPAHAHSVLMRMAVRRAEMLGDMAKAERVLRVRLSVGTSRALRAGIRAVAAHEVVAHEERVRLTELLTPPTDLRHSV